MMPQDVSNWDKDKVNWEYGSENWTENATSWNWDEDDAWINYIGHPYFGSAYYIHARHYGYSRMESFLFLLQFLHSMRWVWRPGLNQFPFRT